MIFFGIFIINHRSHLKKISGVVDTDSRCTNDGDCYTSSTYMVDEIAYPAKELSSGKKSYKKVWFYFVRRYKFAAVKSIF